MELINTVEQLKETVKVNASLNFNMITPYLADAEDKYLLYYLGEKLLERLKTDMDGGEIDNVKLLTVVRRALGPFALALATYELSIMIGDAGHTVSRNDKYAAASDNKVALSAESMLARGWDNLERVLKYMEEHERLYPEWRESGYYLEKGGCYLNSAREFQELGKVDIGYSRLTFEAFRPLLGQLEIKLRRKLTPALDDRLREKLGDKEPGVVRDLIAAVRVWEACQVAVLHTSKAVRVERGKSGVPEFKPVIRPLYKDLTDTGNFYEEQAGLMMEVVDELMKAHAAELGLVVVAAMDFNSRDKNIFVL